MEPKRLYNIKWTQPYPTERLRPYLRQLQEELEDMIEASLEYGDMDEAKEVIDRVKRYN